MRKIVVAVGLLLVLGGLVFAVRAGQSDSPSAGPVGTNPDGLVSTTTQPTPALGETVPRFEEAACSFQRPDGAPVQCGYLVVPEDRDTDDGRLIRLHVAVFASRAENPEPDPVVYLDGGPGGEPLEALMFGLGERFETILETRDLVIFDQRGTGFSEPALNCPAYRMLGFELLDQDLDTDVYIERELQVLQTCRDQWRAEGIDLAQYNSTESAADVADLRVALGYQEWNLYGVSYGTRLALTVMRDRPDGVRSVVLDSTYPPEADGIADFPLNARRAFDQLFDGCASDQGCRQTYGDIEMRLFELVDAWNVSSVTVSLVDLINGGQLEAVVDGTDLLGVVFQSLYAETLIPILPKLIDELESGDTSQLSLILSIFLANGEFFSPGMYFSVQCNEEVSFADPDEVAGATEGLPYMAQISQTSILQSPRAFSFCEDWGAGRAKALDNDPVESEIPTLVMAGSYDPITPPADGRAVADHLANGFFVEFAGLGHGVSAAGECPLGVMIDFLDAPSSAPDTSCIAGLTGPDWELVRDELAIPDEVVLVPFEMAPFGLAFEGMIPRGWEDQGNGTFARLASPLDQTAVVVQGFPGEFADQLVNGLLDSLPLDRETVERQLFDDGSRVWRYFTNATFGLELTILVTETEGNTFLVMVLSDAAEIQMAVLDILQPVAAALRAS